MRLPQSEDTAVARRRPLYFFLIATLGTGALASLFSQPAIPTWYASLNKPFFAPPGWLLAPISTAMYVVMAFAAWRAWKRTGLKSASMALFALQLALNLTWNVVFFGLHGIRAALIGTAVLDMAALATLLLFFRNDRLAGLLLFPYLAWALFATVLMHALAQLN